MKRWQFSLAGLFFVTTIACLLSATMRDPRVCVVATVSLVAGLVLAVLVVFASLGSGDDVPDLDD